MNDHPVILFDGICNFCNSAVNFTLRRNAKQDILFAPLQSEPGIALLQQYQFPAEDMASFVFIENGKAYRYSTAALKVCRHLRGLWPLCYGLIIVPAFIRDGIYKWIGKNRYKWFGKKESCMIPTPETRKRFLS